MRVRARLSGELPEGWQFKESMTFLDPDRRVNLIFSSEPLAPEYDAVRYAQEQGDLLRREFRGFEEFSSEPARVFGGHDGWLRRFAWRPPDDEPVMQLQAYLVVDEWGYTATVTTVAMRFAEMEPAMLDLLLGLRIEDPAAPVSTTAPEPPLARELLMDLVGRPAAAT